MAAGAFGAHALRDRLGSDALAWWDTGARYLLAGGFGLVALGLAARLLLGAGSSAGPWRVAAVFLGAGSALFAATLFAMALGAPRWLGAVTPLGGAGMIAGLCLFAWASRRRA